jgi:hypothetical protein
MVFSLQALKERCRRESRHQGKCSIYTRSKEVFLQKTNSLAGSLQLAEPASERIQKLHGILRREDLKLCTPALGQGKQFCKKCR